MIELLNQHDEDFRSAGNGASAADELAYEHFFTGRRFPEDGTAVYIGDEEVQDFIRIIHTYYARRIESRREVVGNVTFYEHTSVCFAPAERGQGQSCGIVACMRKLLTILNAMVKTKTAWRPA